MAIHEHFDSVFIKRRQKIFFLMNNKAPHLRLPSIKHKPYLTFLIGKGTRLTGKNAGKNVKNAGGTADIPQSLQDHFPNS